MSFLDQLKSQAAALQGEKAAVMENLEANIDGFGLVTTRWPAEGIDYSLMDELAKLVLAQPSRFL